MSWTPVTLTGEYSDGENPLSGDVTVTLSQPMAFGGKTIIPTARVLSLLSSAPAYSNTTAYVATDQVSYLGSVYVCILGTTGNPPTDPTYWTLVGIPGTFSRTFYPNTYPGVVPTGTWYQVTEQLNNGISGSQNRDYSIQIPAFEQILTYTLQAYGAGTLSNSLAQLNSVDISDVTLITVSTTDYFAKNQSAALAALEGQEIVLYNQNWPSQWAEFTVGTVTVSTYSALLEVTYVGSFGVLGNTPGDLIIGGPPLASIDISNLMPGTPQGFHPSGNPSGSFQWTTYLDYAEVIGYLQMTNPAAVGSVQSQLLQRLIDSACYQGQKIANRPLAPTTIYERHDGWSGEYIQLDYSPIIRVAQCQEWQSSGGFVQLFESTPENPVDGIQINYESGRVMRTFTGYSWPKPFYPGSRNIEFTYVAGFNPVPPDVWTATMDLVAYWYRNAIQATRSKPQSQSPYGGPAGAAGDLYPGIPNRIAEVFESYRLVVIG